MSPWNVAREQWVAWIEQGAADIAPAPGPLDSLDAQLAQQLALRPFVTGEETISRPELAGGPDPFDSMTTMIRSAVDGEADEDEATRIRRPGPLEVGLRAPEDALEVSLHPAEEQPTILTQAPALGQTTVTTQPSEPMPSEMSPSLVPVLGQTMVATQPTAPIPSEPAGPPVAQAPVAQAPVAQAPVAQASPDTLSGQTIIAQAPPTPETDDDDDGLFIPALTKTLIEPAPIPVPDEPLPDPLSPAAAEDPFSETLPPAAAEDPFSETPQPTVAEDPFSETPPAGTVAPEPFDEPLPPAISGQTVVGPPPGPPDEESAGVSASGFITTQAESDEAAQTLIRGEIPYESHEGGAAPPRPQKVVIDPSASGVLSVAYDEDEPDEPAVLDEEPQELDADDLVEEALVEEDASEVAPPPPAPSRPPPAPALGVGPPPPPIATSALDAAIVALRPAPPIDEGWQVDMFAEHYVALQPVQRPSVVASEVDFIVHCAGLAAGSTVLDVGCGDGAHSVAMAARGLAVTGLDASPAQLMRASQNAQAMGLTVNLVSGDMRQPPIEGQFDAIVCLGGTLGMFGDEDDRLTMQHMRDRLLPGGRLMLHTLNRDYITNRLPARSWWQGQGCLVLDEAQMFSPTSRLHVHRTVVFETGTQFEHNIGLRVYGLTELVHLCAQVGLRVLEYSGSRHTRGCFYGATSSEIWLLAQRLPG